MQKKELITLMNRLGISPSKKMGQNFLIDDNFIQWMIRESDIKKSDKIVEVGPGFGALTGQLLNTGAAVTAIEFDRKLAEWVRNTFVPKGLNLIEGDACKTDFTAIYGEGADFRLISNLPYSAGSVIIANLLDLQLPPKDMFVMLQKEVADRFAASVGTSEYGALSARIQTVYTVEILRVIPPELFFPRPEIDSCVIRLTRRTDIQPKEVRKILSKFVRAAFAHRRKMMFKQAAAVFGTEMVQNALAVNQISADIRAERVTPDQFRSIAEYIAQNEI